MRRVVSFIVAMVMGVLPVVAQHGEAVGQVGANAEEFRQRDPSGGVMAIIAIFIVFVALVCVFFIVKGFGALMMWLEARKRGPSAVGHAVSMADKMPLVQQLDERIAAIGVALRMYQEEQHVNESTVITINRAAKVYSPWSSKIHGITHMPDKR